MASTRFPAKVMADICGQPMIQRVMERAAAANGVDTAMLATTTNITDVPLIELALTQGWMFYRGPEHDVLTRYLQAARYAKADVIVRVTGDCPLLCHDVLSSVIRRFEKQGSTGYASNIPRIMSGEHPEGTDCEVFCFRTLALLDKKTVGLKDREHVTTALQRLNDYAPMPSVNGKHRHWSVDTKADLEWVRGIYEAVGRDIFTVQDVMCVLERRPELARH